MESLKNSYLETIPSELLNEIFTSLPLPDICIVHFLNCTLYKHTRKQSFWYSYFSRWSHDRFQKMLMDFSEPILEGDKPLTEERKDAEVSTHHKLFMVLISMKFDNKLVDRYTIYKAWYNAITNNRTEMVEAIEKSDYYDFTKGSPFYYKDIKDEAFAVWCWKSEDVESIKKSRHNCLNKTKGHARSIESATRILGAPSLTTDIILLAAQEGNLKLLKDAKINPYKNRTVPKLRFPFHYSSEVAKYLMDEYGKTIKDYLDDIDQSGQICSEYHLVEYFKYYAKREIEENGTKLVWNIVYGCIGAVDPDIHFSFISQIFEVDHNEIEIKYIYEYCIENGHDYLANKLKSLVPLVEHKVNDTDSSRPIPFKLRKLE